MNEQPGSSPQGPPTVSVLMPVYNAERYVAEAVESILSQTFDDFELVAVDDGSKDGSRAILEGYAARDARVRVISRPNTGIVGALNDGLAACRGELVARMDADDVATPERLALQVAFLREHPEVVCVGCQVLAIDTEGAPLGPWKLALDHEVIDSAQLEGEQMIAHPAALVRRADFEAVGGYRREAETAEDLDLFLRLAERGRLANLPLVLLKCRQHVASICHTRRAHQVRTSRAVVEGARRRRGLGELGARRVAAERAAPMTNCHRHWAWMALGAGHVATARKHALASFRRAPFAVETWRVVYCALRGH